ncbi:MAG TPA: hypothetical protein VGO78_20480 [Acidimicrobiales bacterium]|nr:hypothetical protein [Acidimicrobiales bacterium]
MTNDISEADARLALGSIEQRRRQVIAEIDVPRWYWWGVALGWIALGAVTDLDHAWVTALATLVFGAVHSSVAQHVLSGRHRSPQLSVRADVVDHRLPVLVLGYLVVLALVTIGLAVLVDADGAGHPVTIASVVVAVAVLGGGPQLTAAARRRAERAERSAGD